MSAGKLKAGVLGLSEEGQALLKTASAVEHFEIVAVGDKDGTVAEKVAKQYHCAAFDDYRQLIIQNELDCVLIAAGMYSCEQQARMAMKKKSNVLKLAAAARNFE
jgi:predicted dehydrogenase